MDPATQLSGLIGDIHDAALDEALWSEVVGQAGRFVGGPSAAIFSKSAVAGTGDVHYQVGIEAHWRQLYFEKYVRLDPATVGHQLAEIGQPIGVEDLMPYPEFAQSRFYREWARPQGIVDFASAVLDKSPTGAAMFGVFRYEGDGIVDGDARRRMQLIVPHIRRALTVGRLFERKSPAAPRSKRWTASARAYACSTPVEKSSRPTPPAGPFWQPTIFSPRSVVGWSREMRRLTRRYASCWPPRPPNREAEPRRSICRCAHATARAMSFTCCR